jgi:hypothetical protein
VEGGSGALEEAGMKNVGKMVFVGVWCLLLVGCKGGEKELAALEKREFSSSIWDDLHERESLRIGVFNNLFPVKEGGLSAPKALYDTIVRYYQERGDRLSEEYEYTLASLRKDGLLRVEFGGKGNAYLIFREHSDTWKALSEHRYGRIEQRLPGKAKIPNDAIKGDFNGDGIVDYVWLETLRDDDEGKLISYNNETTVRFSGNIPPLFFPGYIGGDLFNRGDLNEDGTDELVIYPWWPTSYWGAYQAFSFKENQWKEILTVPIWYDHLLDGMQPITKHKTKKGYVIVNSSYSDDDINFIIESDTIHLK